PCLRTTIAPRRRAPFRQTLLASSKNEDAVDRRAEAEAGVAAKFLDSLEPALLVVVVTERRLLLVDDHPVGSPEVREAEDPPPRREVRAERVRRRYRGAGGDQLQLAGGDPVVPGHLSARGLKRRAARQGPPHRERSEQVVAGDGCEHGDGCRDPSPWAQPARSDRSCREQDRDQ